MIQYDIRLAGLEDLESIVGYSIALAKESEGKELDEEIVRRGVRTALEQPELARYFVAQHDGRVVGQTMLTMEWSDWRAGSFWWIQSVYVEADFRGQGVFKSIYAFIQDLSLQEENCCGLRLYVEVENEAAIRTYEKLGMERAHYYIYES